MTDPVPHYQAMTLDLIKQAIVERDVEARAELLRQAAYWLNLSKRAVAAKLH
jgi:hypothetical protein